MFGIFKNLKGNQDEVVVNAVKEGAYLVDVRSPGEFASGSVKEAVNIPLDEIIHHIPALKKQQNIVVFCRSGSRSNMAMTILKQNGIQNVYNGGTWLNVRKMKEEQ